MQWDSQESKYSKVAGKLSCLWSRDSAYGRVVCGKSHGDAVGPVFFVVTLMNMGVSKVVFLFVYDVLGPYFTLNVSSSRS